MFRNQRNNIMNEIENTEKELPTSEEQDLRFLKFLAKLAKKKGPRNTKSKKRRSN